MPLVSVIIPAYNSAKTIKETIESVLAQTLTDFELIVVNDGSQDSTLDVVESICDRRLKVFSYENAGVAASRNRGFSHSSGEFICFLDADDLWLPEKLKTQVKVLTENPQASVVYSWVDQVNEAGQFLRPGTRIKLTGDVCARLLLGNFLENGSNPMIRRQAFIEVGGFDETLRHSEDWELYVRLASRFQFANIPSPQVLYRISTRSKSFDLARHEISKLKAVDKIFSQVPSNLQPLKRRTLANYYKYLTFKILDAPIGNFLPGRERGYVAAKYLLKSVRNDWSLLKARFFVLALAKSAAIALMSPQGAVGFTMALNKSNKSRSLTLSRSD